MKRRQRWVCTKDRCESVHVKWLKRPERGRKVEEGACAHYPLTHRLRRAHYIISLVVLHCDRGSSELKASLQKLIVSENCDEKVKSNNFRFEIWSQMVLLVGCN